VLERLSVHVAVSVRELYASGLYVRYVAWGAGTRKQQKRRLLILLTTLIYDFCSILRLSIILLGIARDMRAKKPYNNDVFVEIKGVAQVNCGWLRP
jgi:hypothetical protein